MKTIENHNIIIGCDTPIYPIIITNGLDYIGVVDIDSGCTYKDLTPSMSNDEFEVSSNTKSIKRIKGRVGFVECVFESNSFIVKSVTKENIVFGESNTDLTESVNGYKSSILYLYPYSKINDKFKSCIKCTKYVGGFVDGVYFVKSEILKLSDRDFQIFIHGLDYIKNTHSLTIVEPDNGNTVAG